VLTRPAATPSRSRLWDTATPQVFHCLQIESARNKKIASFAS